MIVFAIAAPIIYMVCEMRNWPLFTYHPGTDRLDLFYAASRKDEGPAMHWYGWTANTLIGGGHPRHACHDVAGKRRPEGSPLSLTWIVPLVCVPVLIYALKFYWRWE